MTEAMRARDASFQLSRTEAIERKLKGLGFCKQRRRRFCNRSEKELPSLSTVSSAEIVADIKELLDQILISLPALSLIRFKTVSKHWLSLISDPDFHLRHTLRNPNPKVSAFFSFHIHESIPLSCPSGNPFKIFASSLPRSPQILQSCNGLFLFHIPIRNDNFLYHIPTFVEKERRVVYVVNPTTNEFLPLCAPSVEKDTYPYKFVRYALAFDPLKSPYYKVICVSDINENSDFGYHQIDIYSSETGAWEKHLEVTRATDFNFGDQESAVYCNGAIHWIRGTHDAGKSLSWDGIRNEYIRDEWDVLHYFDINEECLRKAAVTPPVPSCVNSRDVTHLVHRGFRESSGRLYLIETYQNCHKEGIDVMEMERDYSGWIVKYHVDLNRVIHLASGRKKMKMNGFVVLGLFQDEGKDDDDDDSSTDLWLHLPHKVVSYNCRSNTLKTIVELANGQLVFLHDNYAYMGSLASV